MTPSCSGFGNPLTGVVNYGVQQTISASNSGSWTLSDSEVNDNIFTITGGSMINGFVWSCSQPAMTAVTVSNYSVWNNLADSSITNPIAYTRCSSATQTGDINYFLVPQTVHVGDFLTASPCVPPTGSTTATCAQVIDSVYPAAQTDGATVTWAIGNTPYANASLTFTVHTGSRTLNLTGLVSGGHYTITLVQDSHGGESLNGGSGCTWKQAGGGGSTFTLTNSALAIDRIAFDYDGTNCYATLTKNYS